MPTDILFEKPLPNDQEAERAVIGAILLDHDAYFSAATVVKPEDYYRDAHRKIFARMGELANSSEPIDLVTLRNLLLRSDELEQCGGHAYLAGLTDGLPRAMNVEHYARIVKEKSALRQILQISSEAMTRSIQDQESPQEILEDVESRLLGISSTYTQSGFRPASDIVSQTYHEIEERSQRRNMVVGLDTGFTELNTMTGGFRPANLVIIAGRPGLGKTTLCLNIASHAALRLRKRVGIFSLEMGETEVMHRLLCAEAEVDSHKVNAGYLNREDWMRLNQASAAIADARLEIDETGNISIMEIRSKARQLALRKGLDLLIVDYLQLISGAGRKHDNRVQEISEITRGLKILAKDLNIPIIAASQLNREIERRPGSRRPQLADLRESGSIEQDADVVIFIWREEVFKPTDENQGLAEIIIGKQRNGPTGSVNISFIKQFTKFANLWRE